MKVECQSGTKVNRWTLLNWVETRGKNHRWLCRCECGTEKVVQISNIRSGKSTSCGCAHAEIMSEIRFKHGMSNHPIYNSWASMKDRCQNKKSDDFEWYGGRGIRVCEQWQTFDNFLKDMRDGWSAGLTIERVDVNGNYELSNCRWATMQEQARNKTNNVRLDTPWGRMCLAEAAERVGINATSLKERIDAGWSQDRLYSPKAA